MGSDAADRQKPSDDRDRRQHRLDALVRDNRFTIAVVFPVVGGILLVASAKGLLPPVLSYNPLLLLFGTLVMRLPLVAGVLPVLDRRALAGVLALVFYAYAIEFVGVATGWPYGEFSYLVDLGPMLFGQVPVGLPVFFLPLVLNSYLLALVLLGDRADGWLPRVVTTLALVLVVDLVLDPAAVSLGFWSYAADGPYYGVPLSNYFGWVLSGSVSVLAFDLTLDRSRLRDRIASCEFALDDLVSFVLLWGVVNAVFGNWVPVALTSGLLAALVTTDRLDVVTTPRALKAVAARR